VVAESIGKAYKPYLLASVVVLVGSLGLLAIAMTLAFLWHGETTPLWVIVLAAIGALGLVFGFAGLFLILATAGWRSWRETRRVQVIPPRVR
jgi:membrane protein YdbS with pleckstrin-like domain